MALEDDLLASEERLCAADLDFYREVCRPDALFLMPGMTVGLDEAIAGLEGSAPWDRFALSEVQVRRLGGDAAAISYRFEGEHGGRGIVRGGGEGVMRGGGPSARRRCAACAGGPGRMGG